MQVGSSVKHTLSHHVTDEKSSLSVVKIVGELSLVRFFGPFQLPNSIPHSVLPLSDIHFAGEILHRIACIGFRTEYLLKHALENPIRDIRLIPFDTHALIFVVFPEPFVPACNICLHTPSLPFVSAVLSLVGFACPPAVLLVVEVVPLESNFLPIVLDSVTIA